MSWETAVAYTSMTHLQPRCLTASVTQVYNVWCVSYKCRREIVLFVLHFFSKSHFFPFFLSKSCNVDFFFSSNSNVTFPKTFTHFEHCICTDPNFIALHALWTLTANCSKLKWVITSAGWPSDRDFCLALVNKSVFYAVQTKHATAFSLHCIPPFFWLKTHSRCTLLKWVTWSSMTMNMSSVLYFEPMHTPSCCLITHQGKLDKLHMKQYQMHLISSINLFLVADNPLYRQICPTDISELIVNGVYVVWHENIFISFYRT